MINVLRSVLSEYGLGWTINRNLYSAKLKIMTKFPFTEKLFEKDIEIKRIDLFDFNLETISDYLSKIDIEAKGEIIDIADKAMEGIIKGFSSVDLNFGDPINWHLNPLTGLGNSKDVKWYEIPDFDSNVGDIKVIWEASRLTHFLFFVRAYLITRDKKYYIAFSNQIENWLKNNPYSYGSNYKCGQEATLRMINVLIAYSVFNDYGLITDEDSQNVKLIVDGSYKKVLSNFFYAHKCIKNNHTFSEILGMIIGAWCSDDREKVKKAYKLMNSEISNQFLQDGGYTQYSFNYHRFTLQILECLHKISKKTGISITETDRLKNSVLLLHQVQADNGDVPNYGSNDGALIFPLSTCGYRDFRPVLNTTYALIEKKRLYENGPFDEELLWFGDEIDLPMADIKKKSESFNESGYYTIRHDDGFLMTCLQNYKSRPAHMDQLHIDVWHKGVNLLCDSGTYSYASELGKELTSTIGHNIVKIFGVDQMNKHGAFLVTDWTKRDYVEFNDSSFYGRMNSKNGYSHERKILKKENGYLIEDKLLSKAGTCDFIFHSPCEVELSEEGFILLADNKKIASVKIKGNIRVEDSFSSLYYLRKDRVNRICVSRKIEDGVCKVMYEINLY
ncbi:Heparinase II/III N-terminus [Dethiosulfatibacter aminovorans DSM 17477]|uniref:Heparinase II/III N-terminus n=1 Tax=Dethiosulfatibacter aminovorans DSM 17477 TaxID=1121476 RepID=A0A1M6LM41_9FIRM|nr:alginate lyase family protein [Dethiosulfatibacter aminovorans]SHJ72215.1 Heparinase II/III N-terminus [Dethiosulfatibacter aminovorans DSM 17477]